MQNHLKTWDPTRLKIIGNALIIGIIIGFIVSMFRFTIEKSLTGVKSIYGLAHQNSWWLVAIAIGGLIIALIAGWMVKTTPAISGSGIPQVEGQLAGEYSAKWWSVLWKKFIGGILAIGSGLMLGREGPSIQLGASVGQGYASIMGHRGTDQRVSIAGGAAAGLSAAFNAPIASTLFVLEEIYHNFSPVVWLSALTSAVSANFISLNFFGLKPVLAIKYAHALPLSLYGHLIIIGVILGILGRLYQIVLLKSSVWYQKIKFLPHWLNGIIPLLLIIPIGYYLPSTLGGGNHLITSLTSISPSLIALMAILVVRFVFSIMAYGSGLPGGIFLPILTLGALIGAVYVMALHQIGLMPLVFLPNFIIYAMAGYFAGIGKAPFTAILLITEMVGSLSHLMPLAVVSLIAYLTVDLLHGAPIYESLLHRLVPELLERPSGKQDRIEVPVLEGSSLVDHAVREFSWPANSLLISIRHGENEIIPNGDSIIKVGDTLIVTTQHDNRAFVRHQLSEMAQNISYKTNKKMESQ